jgi:ABC-type phosphate transport system auxiliary subunit
LEFKGFFALNRQVLNINVTRIRRGIDMIEAEEMSIISSIMDDLRVLKNKVGEMEGQIQALADMHSDSDLEVREEYLVHLDELEGNSKFEEFSDIASLRKRIEKEEN